MRFPFSAPQQSLGWTAVTGGPTSASYGSWTSLGTPTIDIERFTLLISGTVRNTFIEIALGPTPGAGTTVLSNFWLPTPQTAVPMISPVLDIRIPAGIEVHARIQTNATSQPFSLCLDGEGASPYVPAGFDRLENIGTFTNVTTFGAAGTLNSAWVEVVAATLRPYSGLYLAAIGSGARTAQSLTVDLGAGASGSERTLITAAGLSSTSVSTVLGTRPYRSLIPAGTRIAMRANAVTTTDSITFQAWGLC